MSRVFSIAAGLLVAVLTVAGCSPHPSNEWGWVTLIDGDKGLENFNRSGDANWRAEGGAIVADKGKGGLLVTKKSYRDFEIRAEFWAAAETNSGIFIRAGDPNKIGSATAYEVNIWDTRPDPSYGSGAIVNVARVPVPLTNKVGGRWNVMEIYASGDEMTIVLNGVTTASARDGSHKQGPFALQFGAGANGAPGGPIKWRKVQVREL